MTTTISRLDVLSTVDPSGRGTLVLNGALDAATAPRVVESVDRAIVGGASTLTIDLSGLRFIDSSGVVVLLGVGGSLGGGVSIHGADGLVRRVLEVCFPEPV